MGSLAADFRVRQNPQMLRHHIALAALTGALVACDATDPSDEAIGTYDRVPPSGQAPRSANCGTFSLVEGMITLEADKTFLKADVLTTPGGSSTCGFIGGAWVRIGATTLELTPDPDAFPGFGPMEVAVEGDQLTFTATGAIYTRRQ